MSCSVRVHNVEFVDTGRVRRVGCIDRGNRRSFRTGTCRLAKKFVDVFFEVDESKDSRTDKEHHTYNCKGGRDEAVSRVFLALVFLCRVIVADITDQLRVALARTLGAS